MRLLTAPPDWREVKGVSKMIRITLISAAAFAGAMVAQADEKPLFTDVDTNFDGVITQEEFVAYKTADGSKTEAEAVEKFAEIAGDDGLISLEEWNAAMDAYRDKKADDSTSY